MKPSTTIALLPERVLCRCFLIFSFIIKTYDMKYSSAISIYGCVLSSLPKLFDRFLNSSTGLLAFWLGIFDYSHPSTEGKNSYWLWFDCILLPLICWWLSTLSSFLWKYDSCFWCSFWDPVMQCLLFITLTLSYPLPTGWGYTGMCQHSWFY